MEVEKISFDETVVEGDFMSHQSLLSRTVKDTNVTAIENLTESDCTLSTIKYDLKYVPSCQTP